MEDIALGFLGITKGQTPHWINPENNLEWYINQTATDYCTKETFNNLPKLNAICFLVCRRDNDELHPLSMVLISTETSMILAEHDSLEEIGVKIDILRLALTNNNEEK